MTEPLVLMCCCPACATLFEVADMQLEQHAGLVRCGECERVFNATWHLVDEPDSASPQPIVRTAISPLNQDIDEAALTTITNTLADEPLAALGRSDGESKRRSLSRPKPIAAVQSPRRSEPHLSRLPPEHEQRLGEETAVAVTTAPKKNRSSWVTASFWALASIFFAGVLFLQARVLFFNELAAIPAMRPGLSTLCDFTGCTVPEALHGPALRIVKSAVNLHPDHPGALIVRVHLTNRTLKVLSYPRLQLTLSDHQGIVVGRRTYHPREYGHPDPVEKIPGSYTQIILLNLADPDETAVGFETEVVGT